ncbi:putative ribonuclease H-like domain-containing protein [Tanacetum coccineum]|uniref:Ribonuclease H-like domain-containing protein n=1 Tax=Tanacetum coccineum TaxID=301880 RepID=A0ABQ5JBT7_9ASTR
MAAPSSSNTNDANTASSQVSAASPSVNTVTPQDLEQIHEDDLEANGCRAPRSKEDHSEIKTNTMEARKQRDTSRQCSLMIGLDTVEAQLVTYRKNEQEKDAIDFKIERIFGKASKDLDQLLGSQITDKSKKGFGYSAVPLPHPLIYNRPNKLYLSYSGLDEFKEPEFKGYGPENSKKESNVGCEKESYNSKENSDKSLEKEQESQGKPQHDDKGFVDSGCSRYMTGNIAYLLDFKEFDGGYVAFGGGAYGGRITGKGTLKTVNLDFEDVYFVNELKFNLFIVSQICDKKNYVLFTDTKCLVLSPNFKLPDENQILLKIPRKDNMYSFDMKNIVPKESLTCLVAKATLDESMLWHRRLGHINFKNINKLVKDNLVRGLPTKHFENNQTCVACLKGKQHRASCKSKVLNPITKPLFMLHIDLFSPTFVSSLMHKKYCLVVTDDYSRFTWVFFLTTKDETNEILKNFIKEIENTVDKKVKIIRSDNGTEFKNKVMDDFCREKGIKREYSVARTPQQNGVAERRNRTLIEAARTMLADSKLPTTFWAKAVSTACYVQNRVLVVKPHNKTPYELFRGTSEENSQDCIVMPIWKDFSYSDSPIENVDNGELKIADDAQKQDEDVNTASLDVNTGSLELNDVGSNCYVLLGPMKKTAIKEEPEVGLGKITNSYIVPTTPNTRIHKDHPIDNVIGEVQSIIEPTSIAKALSDSSWVEAMQEELLQFKLQHPVWLTSDLPMEEAIGINWVLILIEVFTMARIEAIRLFLAYASFIDPANKVYKVVKALYGLHQAPRAWYETLANYLLSNGFKRGKIDQTLFIKKQKGDILLVQVYVDDIIFGSTNKELCTGFEKLMKDKFQMSSIGELTFFLGLQVQQKEDGIFISQDKYVAEILKKFNYSNVKSASTPVDLEKPWSKVEMLMMLCHLYRSMIRSLMYLTASRPDIMFAVCACARFQVTPKTSHLLAVKRIFRYLKGKPTLGLWYSRDSPFELVAYTDSDYAGATLDRKSTTRVNTARQKITIAKQMLMLLRGNGHQSCNCFQFLSLEALFEGRGRDTKIPQSSGPSTKVSDEVPIRSGDHMDRAATTASSVRSKRQWFEITSIQYIVPPLSRGGTLDLCGRTCMLMLPVQVSAVEVNPVIYTSCIEQFWATAKVQTVNGVRQLQALVDKKRVIVTESSIRRDLHLDDAEGEKDKPSKKAQRQEAEGFPKMRQARRVKSSEDQESLGAPEDASKQGRSIEDIDDDVDVSLVDETQERQNLMFDSGVLKDDVMHVEAKVDGKDEHSKKPDNSTAGEAVTTASIDDSVVPTTNEEITLAQTLIQIKAAKPKVVTTAATTTTTTRPKDRGVIIQDPMKTRKEGEVERKPAIRSFCVKWNEDIAIDAIPLATKLSVIVDYKLHKEGMLVHYQLIRADGSSKRYSSMIRMLQGIDREIGTLFEMIVKAKYGDTRPENDFKRVLYGDLKVTFEPDIKSDVWRMLEGYREIPPHTNYNLHIAQQKLQMIIKIDVLSTAEVMVKQQKGK